MLASAGKAGGAGAGTPALGAGAPAPLGGGGATSAGTSGGAGTAGTSGGVAGAPGASFPPVDDLGKNGPYTAMTVMSTGPGGTYTIYRPAELAPGGAKNPIVGWMSGGGSTPSMYPLLPHLASHGFVVVASNTSPALGDEEKLGKEIIAGIEWVLAENAKADSAYHDKLDPTKIASMGYSMGALATTMIAGDPRLTTTVHISGGNMMTDRIKMLRAPAAFLCGASGVDIAGANCATDFETATAPVFYGVFTGGDHLGVRTQPYADRISLVVTGWLRWQLMRDASLAPMFVGDQCTVCKDSNWTVKQKNLM
jgi:dienelactone hydrolase